MHRLDFRKPDETEAYLTAKALRRLSPQQCTRVRQLIEKTLTATTKAQAGAFLAVLPLMLRLDQMSIEHRAHLLSELRGMDDDDHPGA